MKSYIVWLFLLFTASNFAQNNQRIKDSVLVRGNCQMCKDRIETSIAKEPSAKGNWNISTKKLVFSFDPEQTSKKKILKNIAEAGHDNQDYTTDDEIYNQLPDCCLYDRTTHWDNIENSSGTHLPHEEEDDHQTHPPSNIELESVKVTGNKATTSIDRNSAAFSVNIEKGELLKAACCNLSESFETNATVDVNYANAITGTQQIKMLGLDQKYTLMTKELLPEIRGLSAAYGMNFIPGRWISGIQLTKGGSSVTNGYESISGQINTELYKTEKKGETHLNIFGDIQSRIEVNWVHTDTINSQWAHSILTHGNATLERQDQNNDDFLDQPIGRQINMTYLLNYNDLENSGIGTHFGVNFLDDHRLAGQMDFVENRNQFTTDSYGVGIDISRFQLWNKTGYIWDGKPYQSIGLMNQFTYHEQKSYFGQTPYDGTQRTFYSNLIFESIINNSLHKYKTGASFLYDDYQELYLDTTYHRTETVPGLFFEYTYSGEQFTAVAGSRIDFHNLAGTQFTPRLNLKYDLFPKTLLRASAGRGFRTANVFAESQAYLASHRSIEIIGAGGDIYGLDAEIAWNYGISWQQEFRVGGRKSSWTVDYFRTDFKNQILPDLDTSPHKILFYNIEGDSYAKSLQIQWDLEPIRRLKLRLAYKNYDTQAHYSSGKKEVPFTAKHRTFLNVAYHTLKSGKGKQWSLDTTIQWIGKQRLPDTSSLPSEFQSPEKSDPYFVVNAQISRQLSPKFRAYAGAENIFSYTQKQAIVDAENPFGNYFDGGMVYAPIMPINLYMGIDLSF